MLWKTISSVLSLAVVDEQFYRALLTNSLAAVQTQQFQLTEEEQEAFRKISAGDFAELSQQLMALLDKK